MEADRSIAVMRSHAINLLTGLLLLIPMMIAPAAGQESAGSPRVTRESLDQALQLGKTHLLRAQRPEGHFVYEYDIVDQRETWQDNSVRQAGALWGLATIHQDDPQPETLAAVLRGLAFFTEHSSVIDGRRFVVYPGEQEGSTNTLALLSLVLVEMLRTPMQDAQRTAMQQQLQEYLAALLSLQQADLRFQGDYDLRTGRGQDEPSPYADGEALLALAKAARYAGQTQLIPKLIATAHAMDQHWVQPAMQQPPGRQWFGGYYQWGSMAYFEMADAGWPGTDHFRQQAIAMALGLIAVRERAAAEGNTAYSVEGLACAWKLAHDANDQPAAAKIAGFIDQEMHRLHAMQVGHPRMLDFYKTDPAQLDPRTLGGVLGSPTDRYLRIDFAQHQVHAVILCRRFLYPPDRSDLPSPRE